LRQALRLFGDVPMGVACGLEVLKQALALGLTPGAVLVQALSGLLNPSFNGMTQD
jgi:hypothetical protein